MNFMLMTAVLPGSEKFAMNEFLSCIFYLLIDVSKLMNMCLMGTQISRWSDRHVALPTVFDASGSGDLPRPPPMTPVETFMATQTKVLCQILQTQQHMAQQMQQRPPMGANHDVL
jgi:hypothetical protein